MIAPVLILTAVAYSLTNSLINPILVEVARGFHVSVGAAGQARTVLSAAGAVAAFGGTFLADRVPRRRQLLVGLTALGCGHVGLGLVHSFGLWLALQALTGMGAAIVGLAGTAAAGDYFDETQRSTALGWVTSGYPIAWLLGLPLVGWIADAWGWRTSYFVAGGGVAALAAAAVFAGLPAPRFAAAPPSHYLSGWSHLLSAPPAQAWIVGELVTTTAWSSFLVYVGAFFGVTYGLPPGQIGLLVAAGALVSVGATSSSGWLGARFGARRVLLASTLLASLAIAFPFGLRLTPLWSLALILPYYFLSSVRFPTSGAMALSLLPSAPGTMMATRGLTITMGGVVGTVLAGLLVETLGFGAVGAAYAILTAAGGMVFWRGIPREATRAMARTEQPGRGASQDQPLAAGPGIRES